MLTAQDNEILCRVGPGSFVGEMMREYWIPALASAEFPAPDCPPLRLRLLGENLIAFRTTSGDVGIMQNACPHRGASMFFGRNEEEGLRCVYHGWKFDVSGACVDMPSEPAESNFKSKVRAVSYPARERNGVVWVYMGRSAEPPGLPELEANLVPADTHTHVIQTILPESNYMQALEGDIDTAHSNSLHDGADKCEDLQPRTNDYYRRSTIAPKFVV